MIVNNSVALFVVAMLLQQYYCKYLYHVLLKYYIVPLRLMYSRKKNCDTIYYTLSNNLRIIYYHRIIDQHKNVYCIINTYFWLCSKLLCIITKYDSLSLILSNNAIKVNNKCKKLSLNHTVNYLIVKIYK